MKKLILIAVLLLVSLAIARDSWRYSKLKEQEREKLERLSLIDGQILMLELLNFHYKNQILTSRHKWWVAYQTNHFSEMLTHEYTVFNIIAERRGYDHLIENSQIRGDLEKILKVRTRMENR